MCPQFPGIQCKKSKDDGMTRFVLYMYYIALYTKLILTVPFTVGVSAVCDANTANKVIYVEINETLYDR